MTAIARIVAATIMGTLLLAAPVAAQERIGFGFSHISDGNCPSVQQTMSSSYERTSDTLVLRGRVRSAPAGGDCRVDSFAYDVRIARYFAVGGVDATVEFAAAEESTAAPYVLTRASGHVIRRPDGGALFGTSLPAGSAQTIVAAVGLSRVWNGMRFGALVNLAPIDWAEHAAGRTMRLTWDADWRGLYSAVGVDAGAANFGAVSAGYRRALADSNFDIGAGVTHRWGLSAVDNGAPLTQMIEGSHFLRDGPPQDTSTTIEVTLGYTLGG